MDEKVDKALSDLETYGRHWLPDEDASEVLKGVQARLPNHTVVPVRTRPWVEHVLVDTTENGVLNAELLEEIAHQRKKLRGRNPKGRLPK